MSLKHRMKTILPFLLTMLVAESSFARGWHSSSHAPAWLYQLEVGIIAAVLLFFLIKKPLKTVLVLLAVAVMPALLLLTVGYLDKYFGFPATLLAIPVLWFAVLKVIDLVFKDNEKR